MSNRNLKDAIEAYLKKFLYGPAATIRKKLSNGKIYAFIDNGFRGLLAEKIKDYFEKQEKNDEATETFKDIFGPFGYTCSSSLGNKTYLTRTGWSPDNFAAFGAIKDVLELYDVEATVIPNDEYMEIDPDGDVVVIGGPVSTRLSMVAFEFEGPNHDELNRPEKPIIPLKYYGVADKNDIHVRNDKMMCYQSQGMGVRSGVNWHLVNAHKNRRIRAKLEKKQYKDTGSYLPIDNYLTVTRIPNFVAPSFKNYLHCDRILWPYLLIFDGMHAIGTRATELLVSSSGLKAIKETKTALRQTATYQLLYRITDLHLVKDKSTGEDFHIFHRISLEDVISLDDIDNQTYRKAHDYAKTRYLFRG